MIQELYRCYGVRVHTSDISPAQTIGGITQYGVGDDPRVEREQVDGNVFPSLTTLLQHQEKIEFTSLNVDKMVNLIGSVGLCARGTSAQTGFEMFLNRIDQCTPGVDVSAVNMRLSSSTASVSSVKYGMLVPGQIQANHAAHATMSAVYHPTGVSGNSGLAVAENIALPAIADSKSRFSLAELFTINGVSIVGKKGLSINFNVSLLQEGADGTLAPEWVSIESLMSVITVTGINPKWALAANIPRGGKTFAHANMKTFLRKRKPDSTTGFYPDGDLEHIKVTAAGKCFMTNIASGSAGRPAESALVMYVEFDGTNAPIVLNTAQAIA